MRDDPRVLLDRVVERNLERGAIRVAPDQRRAVRGGEDCEPDADADEDDRNSGRPRCPCQQEQRELERERTPRSRPLGGAKDGLEDACDHDRSDERDQAREQHQHDSSALARGEGLRVGSTDAQSLASSRGHWNRADAAPGPDRARRCGSDRTRPPTRPCASERAAPGVRSRSSSRCSRWHGRRGRHCCSRLRQRQRRARTLHRHVPLDADPERLGSRRVRGSPRLHGQARPEVPLARDACRLRVCRALRRRFGCPAPGRGAFARPPSCDHARPSCERPRAAPLAGRFRIREPEHPRRSHRRADGQPPGHTDSCRRPRAPAPGDDPRRLDPPLGEHPHADRPVLVLDLGEPVNTGKPVVASAPIPPAGRGGRLVGLLVEFSRAEEFTAAHRETGKEPTFAVFRSGVLRLRRPEVSGVSGTQTLPVDYRDWVGVEGTRPQDAQSLALRYQLTQGQIVRLRPAQPTDDGPIPVIASSSLASAVGSRTLPLYVGNASVRSASPESHAAFPRPPVTSSSSTARGSRPRSTLRCQGRP